LLNHYLNWTSYCQD